MKGSGLRPSGGRGSRVPAAEPSGQRPPELRQEAARAEGARAKGGDLGSTALRLVVRNAFDCTRFHFKCPHPRYLLHTPSAFPVPAAVLGHLPHRLGSWVGSRAGQWPGGGRVSSRDDLPRPARACVGQRPGEGQGRCSLSRLPRPSGGICFPTDSFNP